MAGKIFINCRRGYDVGFTQALYLRLEGEFTAVDLFVDVEAHIKPGDNFARSTVCRDASVPLRPLRER